MNMNVVVVPGFMGGELFVDRGPLFGARLKVWLNYPGMAAGVWKYLDLNADGETCTIPGVGVLSVGGSQTAYYGELFSALIQAGFNPIDAGVDWRRTIVTQGEELADKIVEAAAGESTAVVAHSQGGLFLRQALSVLARRGQLQLVRTTAGLGVPHFGAMESSALLAGWQETAQLLAGLIVGERFLQPLLWLLGELRPVIISWPGLYQLLPAPQAPGLDPREAALLYDEAAWAEAGYPVSGAWLDVAHQFWVELPDPPAATPWLDVVGTSWDTPFGVTRIGIPRGPQDFGNTLDGDGVVPAAWAGGGGRRRVTAPTAHAALVRDWRVLDALTTWLTSGLPNDLVIVGERVQ